MQGSLRLSDVLYRNVHSRCPLFAFEWSSPLLLADQISHGYFTTRLTDDIGWSILVSELRRWLGHFRMHSNLANVVVGFARREFGRLEAQPTIAVTM